MNTTELKTVVKEYVQLDTTIKAEEKKLRSLRQARKAYSDSIQKYLRTHRKQKLNMSSQNIFLTLQELHTKQSLTPVFLKTTMAEFFEKRFSSHKANTMAENLLQHIQRSRGSKSRFTLKRLKKKQQSA